MAQTPSIPSPPQTPPTAREWSPFDSTPVITGHTGRVLNARFELHDAIGSGGSGIVYRALDRQLNRPVAVKVLELKFDPRSDPSYRERFANEAALTAKLNHPNIVTVFDHGETEDGVLYIAMELLQGSTLHDALANEGRFGWRRAVEVSIQICRALREAHALGLVHRDLKPANIFLVDQGDVELVKVLDFGLAKPLISRSETEITQTGVFLGSPTYMAPEQARNETSAQSDIYSLGITMYRMFTGQVPFSARTPIDIIVQHLQAPVPAFGDVTADSGDLPPELELVVRRCLQKAPRDRYPTMAAVLDALLWASGTRSPSSGPFPRPSASSMRPAVATDQITRPQQIVIIDEVSVPIDLTQSQPVAVPLPLGGARSARLPWILSALLATVVGISVGAAWIRRPQPVAAAPTPAAPALPRAVRFKVSSIPSGASLKVDGRSIGTTPATFEVMPDADALATANISLELEGYLSLSFTAGGYGPEVVMVQRLQQGQGKVVLPPQVSAKPRPAESNVEVLAAVSTPTPPSRDSAEVTAPAPLAAPALSVEPTPEVEPRPAAPAPLPEVDLEPYVDAPMQLTAAMKRPELLSVGTPPRYTREAYAMQIEGTAIAKCVISVEGAVDRCRIIKPIQHMSEAIIASLQTRKYRPAELDGKPVEIEMALAIKLTMQRR